ncbi:MAG: hypothetical protein A3B30_02285 [Candidatus Komeilibacteria bacterium RIFCSPLOWO2_01_FULL_52_15]|uniref:Uncharacterized protein n=2 Tax=Candidatus Komeiliibacteriota TaxID=1817908 RepID=A0A1G2BRV8_9BACT|nr:MAG: hypothetical protein A2677_03815 [Candidatus Komeilibacteria bacterium RIFCSPHIGHO2_01_FULL_52_14]OGY91894.1 MAG: hypothetical protein A3B30_02285 [Candidatus Komeilibacteria bacterium RIFCSPLOWO2_01_FULL_52_15]
MRLLFFLPTIMFARMQSAFENCCDPSPAFACRQTGADRQAASAQAGSSGDALPRQMKKFKDDATLDAIRVFV